MRRSASSFATLALLLAVAASLQFYGIGRLLFLASDRGADFLKVMLALPGPPVADGPWNAVVKTYLKADSYRTTFDLFHLTPLSMLISLLIRISFAWVPPVTLFFALSGALAGALALILRSLTKDVWWALCALVCYPLVFNIDRGNLYAAVVAICVITALLRKKPDWLGATIFAIAICIRPNALICILPLMFLDWRFALRTGGVVAIISVVSLAAANAIYHEYTLNRFVAGIGRYESAYLNLSEFVAYRSSAYGALFALGYPSKTLGAMIGIVPLAIALVMQWQGRLDFDQFTFLCMASMVLMVAGFADYHLLIFIVPLILAKSRPVAWASLMILAPKGWWMIGDYTVQIFLNPAIMLTASIYIIFTRARRGASDLPPDKSLIMGTAASSRT